MYKNIFSPDFSANLSLRVEVCQGYDRRMQTVELTPSLMQCPETGHPISRQSEIWRELYQERLSWGSPHYVGKK